MSWVAAGIAAIGGAATLGGALIGSKANKQAADTASQGQREAAALQTQYLREAQDKQLGFAREGQGMVRDYGGQAIDYLKTARADAQPGVDYLRRTIADQGDLTAAQQAQLADMRRNVSNTIGSSSLAGSGRTAASLFRRAESDFTNDALDRNRARADSAAGAMAGRAGGFDSAIGSSILGTGTALGNISVGTGTAQAGFNKDMGTAQGNAAANSGIFQGHATAASGDTMGRTLGNLGGVLARYTRDSRYGDQTGDNTPAWKAQKEFDDLGF